MRIAVLGTGMVGRALAGRLASLGHDLVIGTRDVSHTLARTDPDARGTPPYHQWQQTNPDVRLMTYADAGAHGDIIVNATAGAVSLAALEAVGPANLAGKVLVDVAEPLDRAPGRPPVLIVANTDSLGEQIQRTFPDTRVVKTLNTMFAEVMINPARVPGSHNVFLAGDDAAAKETVTDLLRQFGWPQESIMDLGGIQAARATEMYMPLYFTLSHVLGTFDFNIAIAHQ
jgi:predicted dinucleotide-binding enzyme